MTRPPVSDIEAPPFPRRGHWIGAAGLSLDELRGRPLLVEFWDFCRPNSLRTLPYLRAWHGRYAGAGLQVVGIHAPGFPPSFDPGAVEAAVARLEVPYPVLVDERMEMWTAYENLGWPARYLFDADLHLFEYHFGEGAYAETETAIRELLGVSAPGDLVGPLRPGDDPEATLVVQSDDVEGPYSGPYEAGGVWAVLSGDGTVTVAGVPVEVDHPGAYELLAHDVSVSGELALGIGDGVVCHAVCFTPGLAP